MKVGVVQISSESGDFDRNLEAHIKAIKVAALSNVSFLVFPELSLIGYEPASFNAELTYRGFQITSCDPMYQFAADEIRRRIDEVYPKIMVKMRQEAGINSGVVQNCL
nr:nitrilase-related carbon-nitrogen hydrolase [Marinobacter alexandrii]